MGCFVRLRSFMNLGYVYVSANLDPALDLRSDRPTLRLALRFPLKICSTLISALLHLEFS